MPFSGFSLAVFQSVQNWELSEEERIYSMTFSKSSGDLHQVWVFPTSPHVTCQPSKQKEEEEEGV
jgi:hypothetical protein